ncbi:GspE/PulE family protein [Clostridium cylindrosporum]|uniref:Type II secretory pathway, ATPase PulE/Tfp pilus assembly pathway, ATPase PilB n=1 Tax=Clostridium cylindrosporum DSM 605 TaxID=1121307 RepID=A0A0J8D594_CLOCY|nr:GspE/PulE family protein [Clostridium cylindrosporum]KMT21325.1 type II secretory pathway, ATPase PulE/Tfp pilus assembly pathway, ATPase PilB [Clostridium cylindrosporum DSM 605]
MFSAKSEFKGNSIIRSISKNKSNEIFINVSKIKIDPEAAMLLPKYFCKKYTMLPMKIDNHKKTMDILVKYPLVDISKEDIKFICGYDPAFFYVKESKEIEDYIDDFLSETEYKLLSDIKVESYGENSSIELDSPAIKLVNTIFHEAINLKASDIHIEPFKKFYKVRFRIDGVIREGFRFNKSSYNSVISRIKVLSKIDISEKRLPLDGRLSFKSNNKSWDFRVSTMPTINGEKIVIRIFQDEANGESINEIGLLNDNLNIVKKFLNSKNGIIIVAGPTGSGKSTTLYTLIRQLDLSGQNIVTIEDPVEQNMEDIIQINVNQTIGFDFASGLRSILRQDPDVIMVGEIRDGETANIAMKAAITGHMVLSTIHTFDCASVIDRLLDMNVEPYMIASGLAGIISQRLVRRICNICKEEYTPRDFEVNILGIEKINKLSRGLGCKACGYTGYDGRIGIFEVMEIKDKHKEAILLKRGSSFIRGLSIEKGMTTLENSCKNLVIKGITTIEEMFNTCNLIK